MTVCEGIAERYEREYGQKCLVLTNAGNYRKLKPSQLNGQIRLIHHGACSRIRNIECMIYLMDFLDEDYCLDLMLVPMPEQEGYYKEIVELCRSRENVCVIPPVATEKIPEATNSYDIGLFLLPPGNFSYLHALPNKFFEYVQARLCIAIGPSPEMMKYVNKFELGVVSESFSPEQLARDLKMLSREQILQFKCNADKAAEILSASTNQQILSDAIMSIA